jgi:hypothetical protein
MHKGTINVRRAQRPRWLGVCGLAVALITVLATPAAAQIGGESFDPFTVELRFQFVPPFGFGYVWSLVSAFRSPNYAAPFIFNAESNIPGWGPPSALSDEQRCNSAPTIAGAQIVIPLRQIPPGTYTVTYHAKVCVVTNGVYSAVEVASTTGWVTIDEDGYTGGAGTPTPEGLKIQSKTTRWRPQRDVTQPIVVNFRGPTNLDPSTVRLQVTPPTGVSAYSATIGSATPVEGTPGEYSVWWTGPWTVPNAAGAQEPLPSGDYELVLRGRAAGAAEDLESPPYSKVSLVEVIGLEFAASDFSTLDPNPGADGAGAVGDRIFAEATQQPTRENPHPPVSDMVQVTARLSPAVENVPGQPAVKVFFRAIDVDDPSTTRKPVDDEGRAADNRGDASAGLFSNLYVAPGTPPDAAVGAVLGQTVSSPDEAAVAARVSPKPGDNYRFMASTARQWVEDAKALQGAPPGTVPLAWLATQQGQPLDQALEGQRISKVLTVWRTLHIELDRLVAFDPVAAQAAMDVNGTFTGLKNSSLDDNTAPFVSNSTAVHWAPHARINDWQGGEIRLAFHAGDLYDVVGNGTKDVSISVKQGQVGALNGLTSAQALLQDRRYVLQDDHIESLTAMAADLSLAEQLLRSAYIRVIAHGANEQSADIPFVISPLHQNGQSPLDRRNLLQPALYSLPAEGLSKPFYWSIQVVSAFEGDPTQDKDPQNERLANLGGTEIGGCYDGTGWIGGCKVRSAVYLESIRDLVAKPQGFPDLPAIDEIIRRSTAHELFHALELPHGKAIMCAGKMLDKNSSTGNRLDPDQVAHLRDVTVPTKSASTKPTCQ